MRCITPLLRAPARRQKRVRPLRNDAAFHHAARYVASLQMPSGAGAADVNSAVPFVDPANERKGRGKIEYDLAGKGREGPRARPPTLLPQHIGESFWCRTLRGSFHAGESPAVKQKRHAVGTFGRNSRARDRARTCTTTPSSWRRPPSSGRRWMRFSGRTSAAAARRL